MHREARKEGLTLKAFVLKRCLGIKPEPRGKESKPKVAKPKAKSVAQPQA